MAHKKKKDKKPPKFKRFEVARKTAQSTHTQKQQMLNKVATEQIRSLTKLSSDPNVSARDRIEAGRRASRVPTLLARQLEKSDNDFQRAMGSIDAKEGNFSRSIGRNMERLEVQFRLRGHGGESATRLARDEMIRRMGADVEEFIPKARRVRQDGYLTHTFMSDKDKLSRVRHAATKAAWQRGRNYVERTTPEAIESKRRGVEMKRAEKSARLNVDPNKLTKEDAKILNDDRARQIVDIRTKWREDIDQEDDPIRRSDKHSTYAGQVNRMSALSPFKAGDRMDRNQEEDLNSGLRGAHRKREDKAYRIATMMGKANAFRMPDVGSLQTGTLASNPPAEVADLVGNPNKPQRPPTPKRTVDTRQMANTNRPYTPPAVPRGTTEPVHYASPVTANRTGEFAQVGKSDFGGLPGRGEQQRMANRTRDLIDSLLDASKPFSLDDSFADFEDLDF